MLMMSLADQCKHKTRGTTWRLYFRSKFIIERLMAWPLWFIQLRAIEVTVQYKWLKIYTHLHQTMAITWFSSATTFDERCALQVANDIYRKHMSCSVWHYASFKHLTWTRYGSESCTVKLGYEEYVISICVRYFYTGEDQSEGTQVGYNSDSSSKEISLKSFWSYQTKNFKVRGRRKIS